jgi:superfamily II DNA or RNA helicase
MSNNIECNDTNNNLIKGFLYEKQIKDYIINNLQKNAYLWSETPETILISNGIIGSHNDLRLKRKDNKLNPLRDTGIDIIQIENNNKISFVQCKNGYMNGLRIDDLAGFSLMSLHHYNNIVKGYVYFTSKLSNNITLLPSNNKIIYIQQLFKDNILNKSTNVINLDNSNKSIKPFDYQLEAKNNLINYFKTNKRGILSLPCGTGKTLISYISSIEISKQIIIISPLKQFAKQNLDRFVEYGFDGPTLLIDSDGTRNFNEIKKFIKSNKKKFLISSTFCSVDIINKCLDYFTNPFIIVDEFHNLSKTNVSEYINHSNNKSDDDSDDESDNELDDESDNESNNESIEENIDDFYQILKSDNKILFVSATPRIYELESDDIDYNEELFGKIIYKMSFNYAIKNNLICDYAIWLPSIHENNDKLKNELDIYQIDDTIKAKCIFLISCLLNTGSMKTILYCYDTKEIKLFEEAIKKLDDYFVLDCEISKITSDTSSSNRKKILDSFASDCKTRQLLFSVRILDECVDIPSCDSIFITYPTKSKIRTIQRMSRATRLNPSNKFKKANIFLWQ